jgi:uncharacterized membrane protein
MIDFGIYSAYVLIGVCIVGILGFSLTNIAKNPGGAKSALVGIIALLAIFGITYAMSSGEDVNTLFAGEDVSETTSRIVGMGLSSFYVLGALAILAVLYVEVTRLFK